MRTEGEAVTQAIYEPSELLNFLWNISLGKLTRCITSPENHSSSNAQLPLNPLAIYRTVVDSILKTYLPLPMGIQVGSTFNMSEGIVIPYSIWSEFVTLASISESTIGEFTCTMLEAHEQSRTSQKVAHEDETHNLNIHPPANLSADQHLLHCSEGNTDMPQLSHFQKMIMNEKAVGDTTQLRRNTRSTKYDGFRVPQVTDVKQPKSKVKPRVVPALSVKSKATNPHTEDQKTEDSTTIPELPPPTPIQTIQCIGTKLCGIPATDLSPRKLLASLQSADSSSSSAHVME